MSQPTAAQRIRDINDTVTYVMWSVFRAAGPLGDDRDEVRTAFESGIAQAEATGVRVRGVYHLSGLRAEADVLVWWYADTIEKLQEAYGALLRRCAGALEAVWSQAAVHRPAEFNKSHVPAFLMGEPARNYVCVYPFVRSYDWYLLEEAERRVMLRDHGMMARDYPDVRANTIPAFALGDYEWLLAFEADELHRIVDLMRHLRGSEARRHVREEVPFFTGPRVDTETLFARLP